MFLKRLLGRPAPATKAVDRDQLIATALGSTDGAARRNACHALFDLPTLRQVAANDAIAGIRELASARYRNLLCGRDPRSPPVSERLSELALVNDQNLLAHVAIQAAEAELRLAAIAALDSPQTLAECAVRDPLAANRLGAAERLHDKAVLALVARRTAKRDKTVYRLVRQRLKAINDSEERPRRVRARCETLCERLERLGRFDNWVQDHALLGHLEQQWAELEDEADTGTRERYLRLRQNFLDAYAAYAEKNAAQLAEARAQADAADRRRTLTTELRAAATLSDLATLDRRVAEIAQAWDAVVPSADQTSMRAYREAWAATDEQRSRLQDATRREHALARLLADTNSLLKRSGDFDQKRLATLRRRLERIRSEQQGSGDDDGLNDCTQALERLQQRFDKHRNQVVRKLAALPERLAELDQSFERGQLRKAEPLYQSITATLKQAQSVGLPRHELAPAEAHLKQIAPRLHELQRWRRWGADTKRDDLCRAIEALADDNAHPLEPMANRLLELRDAWRELDRSGTPADDALWQRFQTAGKRVHERCQPFFEAQAKIRAANRLQRETLCEQLETFLSQVDWERMDWKKAARAEREMRQAWITLGPLEGNRQKPLEGRFRKLLRRLDQALDAERQRNRALKEDLIQRMHALAGEPDLPRAIESAKDLQRQWHTTVPGHQRDENALWKAFRGAGDALFARRAEQQQARGAELRANQATRQAICDELATLAANCTDPDILRSGLRTLEARWRDTDGLPLPRQAVQALQRSWNDSFDKVLEHLRVLGDEARWEALKRLERRATFCDDSARRLAAVEDAARDAGTTTAAETLHPNALSAKWSALPAIADHDLARRLDQAFEQIVAAATDRGARARLRERMIANADRRAQLCLYLEITAGTDSPPDSQQQRMELQVSRLRDRMGEGAADPLGDAATLLGDWYLCAPAEALDGIDERFARAKRALIGARPDTETT